MRNSLENSKFLKKLKISKKNVHLHPMMYWLWKYNLFGAKFWLHWLILSGLKTEKFHKLLFFSLWKHEWRKNLSQNSIFECQDSNSTRRFPYFHTHIKHTLPQKKMRYNQQNRLVLGGLYQYSTLILIPENLNHISIKNNPLNFKKVWIHTSKDYSYSRWSSTWLEFVRDNRSCFSFL